MTAYKPTLQQPPRPAPSEPPAGIPATDQIAQFMGACFAAIGVIACSLLLYAILHRGGFF